MSMLSLVFEAMVAVVLVFAATLCWRLDRRLTALKSGQDGVRQAVAELAAATARAEAGVRDLRAASQEAGRDLERRIAVARETADELALLSGEGGRRTRDSAAEHDAETTQARARKRAPVDADDQPPPRRRAPRRPQDGAELVRESAAEAAEMLARLRGVR